MHNTTRKASTFRSLQLMVLPASVHSALFHQPLPPPDHWVDGISLGFQQFFAKNLSQSPRLN